MVLCAVRREGVGSMVAVEVRHRERKEGSAVGAKVTANVVAQREVAVHACMCDTEGERKRECVRGERDKREREREST